MDTSIENYVGEILKIPLHDVKRRQNSSENGSRATCVLTRELGKYRGLLWREKKLRVDILEQTALILKAERIYGTSNVIVKRHRKRLLELWLELGKVGLKIRSLEEIPTKIDNDFLREVVDFRYFSNCDKTLPCWSETAEKLGISVSGEELRRYVVCELEKVDL